MNTTLSPQTRSLIDELKHAVAEERRQMTRVLTLLRHIEEGRRYLELGYPSLFDFCVRELGYAQDAAGRRIGAMRLIRDVPVLKTKIESGALNLSVINEANRFLRAEKRSGVTRTAEKKTELVLGLEGKSKREAERALVAQAQPKTLIELQKQERLRPVGAGLTRLNLVVTEEQQAKIEKLKRLLSHRNACGSVTGLFDLLLDEALDKHDPARIEARRLERLRKKDGSLRPVVVDAATDENTAGDGNLDSIAIAPSARPFRGGPAGGLTSDGGTILPKSCAAPGARKCPPGSATVTLSRSIPAHVKRAVWLRDGGRCTATGCAATSYLQYDHRTPFALGGAHTAENLRLLCASHNRAEAVKVFGRYE